MMKQLVVVYCIHSNVNQLNCAVFYVLNRLMGIETCVFSTDFPPHFLYGVRFLPDIKYSSLSEPSGSLLRTTGIECYFKHKI